MLTTASKGQSTFRFLASKNEWNIVIASLFPPPPSGRKGPFHSAFLMVSKLKKKTQDTRLLVAFSPAWTVRKLMEYLDGQKNFNIGNWTWIFSDFGSKKVKHGV